MRYAKALAEVVTAPGSTIDPPGALAQLRSVSEVIAESMQLRNVLLSPAVPAARKRAVMGRVAEPLGVSKTVRNFLFVVIDHQRTAELPEILETFQNVLRERQGIAETEVFSAAALKDAQKKEITQMLERVTGKKIEATFSLDANLIGGVRVRVGDTIYDGSLRNRLDDLRERLTAE